MDTLFIEEEQWPQLPDDNPYRIHLAKLLHTIEDEIPMEMPDIVLILISLNTEEKICKFTDWVASKFDGEHINTTRSKIIGAAVRIGEGEDIPF